MRNYKQETKKAYETYPGAFDEYFAQSFQKYVLPIAEDFLRHLHPHSKILDLGSGPGYAAEYFKQHGHEVTCIDISEEMVKIAERKGLKARVMDMEKLTLPHRSFDGIFANASLLHIPKERMPGVIQGVVNILKTNGFFHMSVKKGDGERMYENPKYPGAKRFFANYQLDELQKLFEPHFTIIKVVERNIENRFFFLNLLARLK